MSRIKLPITSTQYILTRPYHFSSKQCVISSIPPGYRLVQLLYAAICGSDLQYYRGDKSPEKLTKRLPLIPLHEGICKDVQTGERFIPLAGDFRHTPLEYQKRPNIWPDLPYLGATMSGLAQTYFIYPEELLLPVSDQINDEVACLVEPVSIVIHALRTLSPKRDISISLIGTGGIARLILLTLRFLAKIPKKQITVYGIHEEALKPLEKLAKTINYDKKNATYPPSHQLVIEAVGGKHMTQTMTLASDLVKPGGTIGILGIADMSLPLRLDQIVNRQIRLQGITRSTPNDYKKAISFLKNKKIQQYISQQIITDVIPVSSLSTFQKAFQQADKNKTGGRMLIKFLSP